MDLPRDCSNVFERCPSDHSQDRIWCSCGTQIIRGDRTEIRWIVDAGHFDEKHSVKVH